jgi:putative methionine-R-sulfoxide reductase with GAF domain
VQRALTNYQEVLDEVRAAIDDAPDGTRAMEATVRLLHDRVPDYNWVGIYVLYSNELVLGPFVGDPSPHTRIPVGRGICGAAASEKVTIIVDDVNADPRYLACSLKTQSEIVVPIFSADAARDVLGEIDIDSDRPAAFDVTDKNMLEAVAALLSPRLARE